MIAGADYSRDVPVSFSLLKLERQSIKVDRDSTTGHREHIEEQAKVVKSHGPRGYIRVNRGNNCHFNVFSVLELLTFFKSGEATTMLQKKTEY